MRKDVDHLPSIQQEELARVRQTLMDEFAVAISRATQPWKKNGKIQKVVLFGSYARDDWVDEPANGYQSDYDILVIVSHKDLTDVAEYWYVAEDKIERDATVARPVNIIVHTLEEVNQGLTRGEYFWVELAFYSGWCASFASTDCGRRALPAELAITDAPIGQVTLTAASIRRRSVRDLMGPTISRLKHALP